MSYVLRCSMTSPVSIRDAFRVFEDPYNLARITPAWLNFKIVSPHVEMRRGAEIRYTIRWLGIPIRWKTIITEYEPPFFFVDEQAAGPYVLWRHRHTFKPTAEGTIIEDRVEYILPFGWLGRLVHKLVVRKQLEGIFEYRQKAVAKLLDESSVAS